MSDAAFHKFGHLPRELRFLIWEQAALEQPRIVELALGHHGERFERPIALMLTSKEAAQSAREIYEDSPITTHVGGKKAFFNYDRDILYITGILHRDESHFHLQVWADSLLFHLEQKQCLSFDPSRVRHLAIAMETGHYQELERRFPGEDPDYNGEGTLVFWAQNVHQYLHNALDLGNVETLTLVFDATRHIEKHPRYFDYSVAKNFKVIDDSKSIMLTGVRHRAHAYFYKPHYRNGGMVWPVRGLPEDLCSCLNKPVFKLSFATVERERVGALPTTDEDELIFPLDDLYPEGIYPEKWGRAHPYCCTLCYMPSPITRIATMRVCEQMRMRERWDNNYSRRQEDTGQPPNRQVDQFVQQQADLQNPTSASPEDISSLSDYTDYDFPYQAYVVSTVRRFTWWVHKIFSKLQQKVGWTK